MTKSQIEEERVRFEAFVDAPKIKFRKDMNGEYMELKVHNYFHVWLAAKQDSEIQNSKVGDIIETPSGLFQVMKHPDSVDDSGITTDGLIRSYCAYCGSGNHDHLPNCKGARG